MHNEAEIIHTEGMTMFSGPDAVAVFRAITLAAALDLYARAGIKANRAYTPTRMLQAATQITGFSFKRGEYALAANELRAWASLMRSGIPETTKD